jgi:peptidoglycan L-alanyl-D-glutamate endopeptidase CwlK
MSRDLADLHSCLRPVAAEFVGRCAAAGLPVLITQTKRTEAEQQALYEQGRTKPGKVVTNAKPGQTPHNHGLAFDIAFLVPETGAVSWDPPEGRTWEEVGILGEGLGLEWGGRWIGFQDKPHFQWPQWRKVAAGGDPTGG